MLGRLGWGAELRDDPVTRGWLVVTGGSLARLGIGFVASVIIARTFGPAELGIYALLAAAAMTVGAVADLGLTESAVKRIAPGWRDAPLLARDRTRGFFWIRTGTTVAIVAVGLALAAPIAAVWHGIHDDGRLLALALLGVGATALSGAVTGILQATGHFGRLSLVLITNAALTACLALALRLAGHLTLATALVVLGIGTSLASFALGRWLLPQPLDLALPGRATLAAEARALFSFGVWVWIANSIAIVTSQVDLLLAGHWLAPAEVGAFALAVSLAAKVDVVNHSLHTALLPTASVLGSRTDIRAYLRRGLLRSGVVVVGLVPLIPLAPPLIRFVFGGAFDLSAALFPALLGVAMFDLLAAPTLLLAFSANRPQILAAANGVRIAALVAVAAWLVPLYGPYGLVLARFAARAAGLILTIALLLRGRGADWPPLPETDSLPG